MGNEKKTFKENVVIKKRGRTNVLQRPNSTALYVHLYLRISTHWCSAYSGIHKMIYMH